MEVGGPLTNILVTCSRCGDVELEGSALRARMCISVSYSEYSFRCPICHMVEVKRANAHEIDVLVAAGAPLTTWALPAELFEDRDGGPIGHDDLLEFHRSLHDANRFGEAVSHLPAG